jgi:CBS domain-containing protein
LSGFQPVRLGERGEPAGIGQQALHPVHQLTDDRIRTCQRDERAIGEWAIEVDQCSDPSRIAGSASVVEFMTASAVGGLSLRTSAHNEVEEQGPMKARDVMRKPVISVHPDTPLREVARLLLDKEISAVPVVDNNGTLIGMVSEGDLIRPDRAAREAWRQSWLEIFAEGEPLAPELLAWLQSQNHNARAVMSAPAVTVTEDTELGEIARVLITHRIKRVPVVRDGRVTGIVARDDLLRALASSKADL